MEKLLLHSCCAPCSSGVLDDLRKKYDVTVFYYNPNIYPESEYNKRADEQAKYLKSLGISYVICDHNPQEYDAVVAGKESEPEGGLRCAECFKLRLKATAKYAKSHGYDLFTTVMSVSPHKNHILLNELGAEIEKEEDIRYLEANFKKNDGYLKSIQNSKALGMYRQNYCGCKYSLKASENVKNN